MDKVFIRTDPAGNRKKDRCGNNNSDSVYDDWNIVIYSSSKREENMKKCLLTLLVIILLVSCASTGIEYYGIPNINASKVFIKLDQTKTAVDAGGIGYITNYGFAYMGSLSETVQLGTIKNTEIIKKALEEKGYVVVNSIDNTDIVMIGESSSNADYSLVTLGFYDKQSNELIYVCEGKYGFGLGIQDDLNKAVKKAIESIPSIK